MVLGLGYESLCMRAAPAAEQAQPALTILEKDTGPTSLVRLVRFGSKNKSRHQLLQYSGRRTAGNTARELCHPRFIPLLRRLGASR